MKFFGIILSAVIFSQGVFANSKLVCVSLLNGKVQIRENPLSDSAMGEIHFTADEWSYTADVLEGKINSLIIANSKAQAQSMAYSASTYPFKDLTASLSLGEVKMSVECDIRAY